MQLGVRNDDAAARAEAAGLAVVMNRCPKIEFSRLFGELGWHGFNSRVISSKRRTPGSSDAVKGDADVGDGFVATGFEPLAVHTGSAPDPPTGPRPPPTHPAPTLVRQRKHVAVQ